MNNLFFAGEEIAKLAAQATAGAAVALVSSLDEARSIAREAGEFFVFPSAFDMGPAPGNRKVHVESQTWTVAFTVGPGQTGAGETMFSLVQSIVGKGFLPGCNEFRRVASPVPVYSGSLSFYMISFSVNFPVVTG